MNDQRNYFFFFLNSEAFERHSIERTQDKS